MLLDAEILSEKLVVYFNEVIEQTVNYIVEFSKERQSKQIFSESPVGRRVPISYNFSKSNINGNWEQAIEREKVASSQVIMLLAQHLKALFLNLDSRDTLLHEFLNISSGRISVYIFIQQASSEEVKIPLSNRFKALDPLTQVYIIFQLRMLVDQIIKEFPLGSPDLSEDLISSKTQEEWVATAAFLRKHESFRMQVYEKLEKFMKKILPTLKRSIANSQKEIDSMLELVSFYFSNSPKGTQYPLIFTPGLSAAPSGISTPVEMERMRNPVLGASVLQAISIKSQLEIPYAISDELTAEIALSYGNLYVKFTSFDKAVDETFECKVTQQYFALKALHEEMVNTGNISPQQVEKAFREPELVSINGKNRTVSKKNVFEKDWGFFESNASILYNSLKKELKTELWNRVKTFDFVYDLIIDDFSNELETRLTNEYDKLIKTPPWFIKAGKFDVTVLSKMEVVELHKHLAIEVIHHAFENSRISVSLIEEVVNKFPAYGAHILPFISTEMKRIVEDFKWEMGESLWKIATRGFSHLNEYKAPNITPRWTGINLQG